MPDGRENLRPPWKPGEAPNPAGANQYTYRSDAERDLARWCKEHGTDVIERLVTDAKKGKGYAMKLVLERILPAVAHHEHHIPGADAAGLVDYLAGIAASRPATVSPGSNGSARANGSSGTQE